MRKCWRCKTILQRFRNGRRSTGLSQDDRKLPNDVEQLKAMIAEHGVALAERDAAIIEQTAAIVDRDETIAQHETVIAAQHETIAQQSKKLDGLPQQLARGR